MRALGRTLSDAATYRRLLFVLSALVLGQLWLVALSVVWSLCLAFVITPLVIPLLIALSVMTRWFAAVEAAIARPLLGIEVYAPSSSPAPGVAFWARMRAMLGGDFWRAQAYLLIRSLVGFPLAAVLASLLALAFALIVAPVWVPFVPGGVEVGLWKLHSSAESLAVVPVGVVLLPAAIVAAALLGGAFRPVASALLRSRPDGRGEALTAHAGSARMAPRRALALNAAVDAILVLGLVVIWALTSRGYFWPVWAALPLGAVLALNGWFVLLAERPGLVQTFGGSRALAGTVGVGTVAAVLLVGIWAITGHGYFWPVWPIAGAAIIIGVQSAAVFLAPPAQAELAERIETLESTRAGAVDVQDSELRRIERDLHDGAQARLVALGMSLGMAEQKLEHDPQRAGELLAEARVGAEAALRELRDLARGIHPPVLADRGLEAAVGALADSTHMQVTLTVDVELRPAPAVESAAYFVVAEALANTAKHATAERLDIRITRVADILALEVEDDGCGGADPDGDGLTGLRHRVEALDGHLHITSPTGGPTVVRADLPCG